MLASRCTGATANLSDNPCSYMYSVIDTHFDHLTRPLRFLYCSMKWSLARKSQFPKRSFTTLLVFTVNASAWVPGSCVPIPPAPPALLPTMPRLIASASLRGGARFACSRLPRVVLSLKSPTMPTFWATLELSSRWPYPSFSFVFILLSCLLVCLLDIFGYYLDMPSPRRWTQRSDLKMDVWWRRPIRRPIWNWTGDVQFRK